MSPKVEPILLWGFCFTTQKHLKFNNSWACAFHTSWYTDENHPMWDSLDDPSKRREIRYGNNIYVLFRALLHCKDFYGQNALWAAIARGFNTGPAVLRDTVDVLVGARRAQRNKPAKDVPDTANAADDWIDFLDSRGSYSDMLTDPEVYKVADRFFKSQEKKHLNAARVPVNGRPSFGVINQLARPPPRGPAAEVGISPLSPSPSVKLESPRETADSHRPSQFGRKRSASPPSARSHKSRKFSHDVRQQPRVEPERHGAIDELPMIQTTRSPPRPSHAQPTPPAAPARLTHKDVPSGPAQSNGPAQSTRPSLSIPQPDLGMKPETPKGPAPVSESGVGHRKEEGPNASSRAVTDDSAALKARLASLEKQLAEAKSTINSTPAATPSVPAVPNQLAEDVNGLKKEMATATNAIGTMMDSMHDIVDSLNSLQDEVSGLAAQHKDLATTITKFSTPADGTTNATNNPNLDAVLPPLQALTNTVHTLCVEIADLKQNQPTSTPTPAPNPSNTSNSTIETLLQAQTTRIDKLSRELASLRQQQQSTLHYQQQQQQQQPQPQTLRQAMAAAERDLKRHMSVVEHFYHHGAGGGSRAVTEQTADFLAMLAEGVRVAGMAGSGAGGLNGL